MALEDSYCLVLNKTDFLDRVFFIEQDYQQKRLGFIENLPFTQDWSTEQLKVFNKQLGQTNLLASTILYDFDDPSQVFYVVKSGVLAVEVCVTIEDENRYPTGNDMWELCKIIREVQYEAHSFGVNDVFGLQEIIDQMKTENEKINVNRKFRVRALTNA